MEAREVRRIRKVAGLTQEEFSKAYRVPIHTVRHWEQGRRDPDAAASSLLHLISVAPKAIATMMESKPSHK